MAFQHHHHIDKSRPGTAGPIGILQPPDVGTHLFKGIQDARQVLPQNGNDITMFQERLHQKHIVPHGDVFVMRRTHKGKCHIAVKEGRMKIYRPRLQLFLLQQFRRILLAESHKAGRNSGDLPLSHLETRHPFGDNQQQKHPV